MLLSTICHAVTSVEADVPVTPRTGPQKKLEVMKSVGITLDAAANAGAQVDRALAESVAGALIDHTVAAANSLGAFQHGAPQSSPPANP